jgi:hypothetical protein
MEKNIKVDAETHRRVSIEAARTGIKKGTLTAALINAVLDVPEEQRAIMLAHYLLYYDRTDNNFMPLADDTKTV